MSILGNQKNLEFWHKDENWLHSKLWKEIQVNSTLTYLRIGRTVIRSALIADALAFNTTLTTLFLCSNELGNAGAIAIAQALYTNTCLLNLSLFHNSINVAGAKHLAIALIINTTL